MPKAGEHYVIIGATRGLGRSLAQAAHDAGASVTITGRDSGHAAEVAASIGERARGLGCDLTNWQSIEDVFDSIELIDHLVLTALDRDQNEIASFRPDDAARTALMKNVGYATAVHHALDRLAPNGSIVLYSGLSMWRPFPGSTTISMANAGVIGLMNSLAIEVAPVRVNTITPGVIDDTVAVDGADAIRKAAFNRLRERTPAKRLPTTADIVAATFALTDNPGINAANLVVDAGMSVS